MLYVSFWKLVYQNKNELFGTSVAFTMIVFRVEKRHCLLKSSVPLPWQPNLIKTLATGAISKLMIPTRKPIPTYTPSILLAYYIPLLDKHVFVFHFASVFHFERSPEIVYCLVFFSTHPPTLGDFVWCHRVAERFIRHIIGFCSLLVNKLNCSLLANKLLSVPKSELCFICVRGRS